MEEFDRTVLHHRISRRVFSAAAATGLFAGTRLSGVAQTPGASPAVSPGAATPAAAEPGSLAAMLAVVPDLFGGNPSKAASQLVVYANIAAQLAAVQVPFPASIDQAGYPFTSILGNLQIPGQLGPYYLDPRWHELFGFSQLEVDQALQVGAPPDLVTLYRGQLHDDQIAAALTKSGYKTVTANGLNAYSLHADAKIDLTSPISQIALSQMNNGVRLPDGTWAFTPTLARLRSVVAAAQGQGSSLAARVDVRAALAAPGPAIASAYVVPGAALQMNGADMAGATLSPQMIAQMQQELTHYGTMPPIGLAILAATVGGPIPPPAGEGTPPIAPSPSIQPVAQAEITLVMPTPAAAESAVMVITKRLANMKSFRAQMPYAEIFPNPTVMAEPGTPVVRLTLLPKDGAPPSIIFSMFMNRDLGFLAW